jgi:hypothetical protein
MRCPICDQVVDHTQGRAPSDIQACPVCRAICRETTEAQEDHAAGTMSPGTDRPLIPVKRPPGVEDVFNWY